MVARRIIISGGSVAAALIVFLIQGFLAMLGATRSFALFGLDIMNTAFFVTYLVCAFAFIWGAVGPLPQ
jgi:hypothetical protein